MNYWVVDANLVVRSLLYPTDSLNAFWDRVDRENIAPCAPRLWVSETASAIRFLVVQKILTSNEAEDALRAIHGLQFEIINEDYELSLRALELAAKLGQSKAYDAFYLALAEKLVVDFWTLDVRLANRCQRDLKFPWVHSVSEL